MRRFPNQTGRFYQMQARNDGPVRVHEQVIPCSCEGCVSTFRKRCQTAAPYPLAVIAKFARRKGWNVDENRTKAYCPDHAH